MFSLALFSSCFSLDYMNRRVERLCQPEVENGRLGDDQVTEELIRQV